jgi:hypothetical protein
MIWEFLRWYSIKVISQPVQNTSKKTPKPKEHVTRIVLHPDGDQGFGISFPLYFSEFLF